MAPRKGSKRKVRVCVMYGDGINCDNETFEAFRLAGAEPRKALIEDVADGSVRLEDYHVLALPGGFSAGDHLGAGKFYAIKMRALIGEDVERFVSAGKLIMGICNGFQVLAKYPLLPEPFAGQTISVTHNESARFEDRWVDLGIEKKSPCVFTRGIDTIRVPCRHGEGRVVALNEGVARQLEDNNQVVARYARPDGAPAEGRYPLNPNGSPGDVAGICDRSGLIFGWMPHPEAFLDFTNDPLWTRKREALARSGKRMPARGEGLKMFRNAVERVREKL